MRFLLPAISILAFTLTACSSGPPKRGGPPGADSGGPRGASAMNGPVARPVALLFSGTDTNGDMVVSLAEANAALAAEWATLSDGEDDVSVLRLSDWLLKALGSPDAQPSTVAFDTNFDGQVTREEFEIRLGAEFDKLDASKDRTLQRSELVFDMPNGSSRDGGGFGNRGSGGPPRGERPR